MRLFFTALVLTLATTAQADEVWTTEMGDIIYQNEANGAAIFTFTNVDAYPATLVIPGLAGNYDNRGTHPAFWIGEGAGACDAFLGLPDGPQGRQWGTARISFDKPSFPTSFTLTLGWCFEPHSYAIRATTTAE